MMTTKRLTVRFERDGKWIQAYCVEVDLLATASTRAGAKRALLNVLWDYWLHLDSLPPAERETPPLAQHYEILRERLLPTMAEFGKERLDKAAKTDNRLYDKMFRVPA
jgi:hypothetical protein